MAPWKKQLKWSTINRQLEQEAIESVNTQVLEYTGRWIHKSWNIQVGDGHARQDQANVHI